MIVGAQSRIVQLCALVGITLIATIAIFRMQSIEGFREDDSLEQIPHYIERQNKDSPLTILNVPTVIYNSWHSHSVPPKMKENIDSLIERNPDFDYYLYSDEDSIDYIQNNYSKDVLNAFNTLKPGAYKSDLWRYCIMYKKGGVYIDIKYNTLEPLSVIVARTPEVFVRDYDNAAADPDTRCFYNGVMISPPNNMLFKRCIDEVVNNCKMKLYKMNCLDVTGPCLLGRKLKEHNMFIWQHTPFTYGREEVNGRIVDYIMYKDRRIMQSYLEYRDEQKSKQKTEHYGKMWYDKNIFA
jgi:mannosyltransferase OCH1-like enzyme